MCNQHQEIVNRVKVLIEMPRVYNKDLSYRESECNL